MKKKTIDLDMKLSKNFTLREFTYSATAERLGIDNTPTTLSRLRTLPVHVASCVLKLAEPLTCSVL